MMRTTTGRSITGAPSLGTSESKSRWVLVSDRLPPSDTEVLVWILRNHKHARIGELRIAKYDAQHDTWRDAHDHSHLDGVARWMLVETSK